MAADPFYAKPLLDRLNAFCRLEQHYGEEIDTQKIQEILDDIADGAGGCERAAFSAPDGKGHFAWVSVIGEEGHRTYYVAIVHDPITSSIVRTQWGSMAWASMDDPTDSPRAYAEFIRMVFDEGED